MARSRKWWWMFVVIAGWFGIVGCAWMLWVDLTPPVSDAEAAVDSAVLVILVALQWGLLRLARVNHRLLRGAPWVVGPQRGSERRAS